MLVIESNVLCCAAATTSGQRLDSCSGHFGKRKSFKSSLAGQIIGYRTAKTDVGSHEMRCPSDIVANTAKRLHDLCRIRCLELWHLKIRSNSRAEVASKVNRQTSCHEDVARFVG